MSIQGDYTNLSKEHLLKDCEWLLNSPALLKSQLGFDDILQHYHLEIPLHDLPFDVLQDILRQEKPRQLGRYVEQLCPFVLEYGFDFKPIIQSLPLHDGTDTVGELDGVFEKNGKIIHVEYKLKIYLALEHTDHTQEQHFVGTYLKDKLSIKRQRLFERQLPLAYSDLATAALNKKVDTSLHWCRGRLLYPYALFNGSQACDTLSSRSGSLTYVNEHRNSAKDGFAELSIWQKPPIIHPDSVTENHGIGFWLRASEAKSILGAYELRCLDKCYWLASHNVVPIRDLGDILNDIEQHQFPRMVSCWKNDIEVMRGFIVQDNWAKK